MILTMLSCIRSHMTSYIPERGLWTHRSHAREHSRSGLERVPWPLFRPFQRFLRPLGRVELGCHGRHHGHAHGSRTATQRLRSTLQRSERGAAPLEPLGRLPAAPQPSLGPSRTPTAPLVEGVAAELKKYEVGRELDAKGVVQLLRGPCRRGPLGPAGTKTTRLVSMSERGHACRARAVETYPARLLLEVVDELQPPGW